MKADRTNGHAHARARARVHAKAVAHCDCDCHSPDGAPAAAPCAGAAAAAMLALSFAPSLPVAVPVLIVVGLASITFITTGNSTIQLAAAPEYRGRVTGLWSTAFVGSTPIGATIIGFVAALSPRWAIVVGALACIVAAWVGWHFLGLHPAPNGDAEDSGAPRSMRYGKRCA